MAFAVARPSIGGRSSVAMAMAKKQREAFSFPVLPTEEIKSCLHEMGIAIEDGDLDKAKNEVVRNIYEQLIYECTGITKEELYTPRPCEDGAGGPIPRFEDLHEESIPTLHYMRALNKLLVAAGVHEGFSLRDLIKPDPGRLRRNLSAIINFQKYREEKVEAWAGHGRRTLELEAMRAQLEAERRDLEQQLAKERNVRALEAPAIAELQSSVTALSHQKAELVAASSKLTAGVEEQRRTIQELKDGASMLDAKAEGLREDIERARGQIVSSPARLKGDVDAATRSVEDARSALAAVRNEANATCRREEVVLKGVKDVKKVLALLSELETEVLKLKKAHKDAKAKATTKEEKATEAAELSSQVERLEKRLKAAEEKLSEQKHAAYVKQEATARANQALREELENTKGDLDRAKATQRDGAGKLAAVKAEHDRIQAAHNAEMAEMTAAIKHLQKTIQDYHARLFQELDAINAEDNAAVMAAAAASASSSSSGAAAGLNRSFIGSRQAAAAAAAASAAAASHYAGSSENFPFSSSE